tara:strand:- start:118992 stop:119633 length:642 start_codon:yes stop_codon:yes gene_type:complete
MKKTLLVLSIAVASLSYSCKETKKDKMNDEVTNSTENAKELFSLVTDSTKVSFTAYKTTEKKPVGGTFKTIHITKSNSGETALQAINGTEFSIPVSSLFTNDPTGTRDPKITEFFFDVMKNPELISGTFIVDGNKCSLDVTLNGETANIPLETEMNSEDSYTFTGVMDLKKWNATEALASLNKVCEVLHTGPDGVSKTWDEVAIKGEVLFKKK